MACQVSPLSLDCHTVMFHLLYLSCTRPGCEKSILGESGTRTIEPSQLEPKPKSRMRGADQVAPPSSLTDCHRTP